MDVKINEMSKVEIFNLDCPEAKAYKIIKEYVANWNILVAIGK